MLDLIQKYKHMHPQDIVQIIYEAILKLQNPARKDDMTILIIIIETIITPTFLIKKKIKKKNKLFVFHGIEMCISYGERE